MHLASFLLTLVFHWPYVVTGSHIVHIYIYSVLPDTLEIKNRFQVETPVKGIPLPLTLLVILWENKSVPLLASCPALLVSGKGLLTGQSNFRLSAGFTVD